MPGAYRVMIRLSPDLYAQLEARGSSGQPLAAIVRQALIDYLARQPKQPEQPDDTRERLTALATHLQELQAHVRALTARVEALAAPQQPRAAAPEPQPGPTARRAPHGLPRETLQAIAESARAARGKLPGLRRAAARARHLFGPREGRQQSARQSRQRQEVARLGQRGRAAVVAQRERSPPAAARAACVPCAGNDPHSQRKACRSR